MGGFAGLRRACAAFSIAVVAALPGLAQAQGADALKAVLADPAKRAAAAEAGRKIAAFCANCHGDSGVSKQGEVPNLAGQNPAYLFEQIRKFGSGERKDAFMQGLIKVLKEDERIAVTAYYAGNEVPAGKGNAPQVAAGRETFRRLCQRCHGEQGHGADTIPRLAGQQVEYLKRSITRYRDKSGERIFPLMQIATAALKDEDIAALAQFLNALP
ncbi:MAG: c-type cytochrome [Azonexus sp.]|nr:c-type cytochrome [Betaproteobacteria bacterium]MBP6034802.1 c-type cytochrome [Azonexus sp.]MBP6905342.1 c-type cytochrome [Azonexus sp.]